MTPPPTDKNYPDTHTTNSLHIHTHTHTHTNTELSIVRNNFLHADLWGENM